MRYATKGGEHMIGPFLLQYRAKNGMTQTELAKKLSISQNAVSQYESGKRTPTVNRLAQMAAALDCTVDEIMADTLTKS